MNANAQSGKVRAAKEFVGQYFMIFIVIAMLIVISIISPTFMSVSNMLNILKQISVICMLSLGMSFLIMSGNNDLGAAASAIFSSAVVAKLFLTMDKTTPLVVAILVALVIGIFVGVVNGAIIAYSGIPAFISTLGMNQVLKGASLLFTDGKIVSNLRPQFLVLSNGSILGISPTIWILLITAVILHIVLTYTRFGKYVRAIGGNQMAARVSGINVRHIIIYTFVLEGLLCAIAGLLLTARMGSANPQTGETYSLDALTGAVIGGTSFRGGVGTMWGVLVGAIMLGVMNSGLNQIGVSAYWQLVVKGTIIVAAVILDEVRRKKN